MTKNFFEDTTTPNDNNHKEEKESTAASYEYRPQQSSQGAHTVTSSTSTQGSSNTPNPQPKPTASYPAYTNTQEHATYGTAYPPQSRAGSYTSQNSNMGSPAGYYNPHHAGYSSPPARASYTWGTAAPMPDKKKKKPGRVFLKAIALLLCCAVVSVSTVAVFIGMIQMGAIAIESSGSETAAFTINRIVDEQITSNVTEIPGQLTPQAVAEKLIPSVVCIQVFANTSQDFFGGYERESTGDVTPSSQGSGIIFSNDGYIVTNAHVISGADSIKVITSDGLTYEAELIGADTMTDLAVIKIEGTDFVPAEFGSSDDLKIADSVMAIGNPGGIRFNSSVTMGYVSALNREVISDETGYSIYCIQTDAAINPGNSGGALVNMYGFVVGINSSKIVATGYEGLGFAIPSDFAQPIISNLIEFGYVKDRAMLGISGQYIDSVTARFYGLVAGMYVTSANTQNAVDSGLIKGDIITMIDSTPVTSYSVLTAYVAGKKPGESVTLTIMRAGQEMTIELVLSEYTGG